MGNSVSSSKIRSLMGNSVGLLISTKLRSLDPTLLYCIDSDWTPLPLVEKNWCPSDDQIPI